MVKTLKSVDVKESTSTRVLYRNSCMNIVEAVSNKHIVLMKAEIEKKRNERKDLSVETDNCILRRLYKEKKRKKLKKSTLPTLFSRSSSILVFKIKRKTRKENVDIPKIQTDEEEDIVIENIKMLMNKYIDKHLVEDDEVMTKIKSSFRAVLNRLTGPNLNVLSPNTLDLDKLLKPGHLNCPLTSNCPEEAKRDKEERLSISAGCSNISETCICVMPSATVESKKEPESNALPTLSASKLHDGKKAKIITKKVRLQKNEDGQNTFVLCMDQSGNSMISNASFEVLTISREAPALKKELNKKSNESVVSRDDKVGEDHEDVLHENKLIENVTDRKANKTPNVDFLTDAVQKQCESEEVKVKTDNSRKKENCISFSNSMIANDEIELHNNDEAVLCILNRDPSEKIVKFLVEPIKDKILEVNVSTDKVMKAAHEENAPKNCRLITKIISDKRLQPSTVDSNETVNNYHRLHAKSYRNIQKSKIKKAIATRKNKKHNKLTSKNECRVLRIECHDTQFTGKRLTKQFKKVNDYLSTFKDKGNITLEIVVKVHSQNEKNKLSNKSQCDVNKGALRCNSKENNNVSSRHEGEATYKTKSTKMENGSLVENIDESPKADIEHVLSATKIHNNTNSTKTKLLADILKCDYQYLQDSHDSLKIIQTAVKNKTKLCSETYKTETEIIASVIDILDAAITHDGCQQSFEKRQYNVPLSKEINAKLVDVIQLLDTSMSHDKYLQSSDKYIKIIETATCSHKTLTAIVNETKAKLIADVLQFLEKAVNRDKRLRNYCNSDPYLVRAHKSEVCMTPVEFADKDIVKIKKNSDPELRNPEIHHILSNLKYKLEYLTAATRDSYIAYQKKRGKFLPRNKAPIDFSCLELTTYDGSIFSLEDIDYLITRFSSMSQITSKYNIDHYCTKVIKAGRERKEKAFIYHRPEENRRQRGEKQSVATQITVPFPKHNEQPRKSAKVTRSYNVIESESIIKVTEMTSGTKYSQCIDESKNTKALTCSLPNSRAMFELVTVDNVSESKVVSFVGKEITQIFQRDEKIIETSNKESAQLLQEEVKTDKSLSLEKAHSPIPRYDTEDEIINSVTDTVDVKSNTYGAKQLCYYLTTKHPKGDLKSSSSFVIEWDAPETSVDQRLKLQQVPDTRCKLKFVFCCIILCFVLTAVIVYFIHYADDGSTLFAFPKKTKIVTTTAPATMSFFNLKEMGFR